MKDQIAAQFSSNLGRVGSLIALYEEKAPAGQGPVPVATADLLRGAVVFLHATVEDLLRTSLEWRLPTAAPEHLTGVRLMNFDKKDRFDLSELASHRGKSVDDVLAESVVAHLKKSNFNHPGEVKEAVARMGVAQALVVPHEDTLGPLMQRRHWIVHRADRNELSGRGLHVARPIDLTTVKTWHAGVKGFGDALLAALP